MSVQRWKITIEYDGTNYSGWQIQEDGIASIQNSLEVALFKFCQQKIRVQGAGRTDAGVHAQGQVAHFDLDYGTRALRGHDLMMAINAHLRPQPISVVHAEKVEPDFHARFGAKNKLYTYRILTRAAPPTFDRTRFWHVKKPLNVQAMQDATPALLGKHDFTSFRAAGCQAKSPVRTLDRLDVVARAYDAFGGMEVLIHAGGRAFLYNQVRNLAG
ncbi:MAG: tRNA pseudouridine(38-40) synthase TruA, partial [Alphaproteobacteria bacterium]|nr:tRNA pseudouridine(38-40) synthase TruA [Alphaproteobacteria bacterium]